jgi:hypothetical protein
MKKGSFCDLHGSETVSDEPGYLPFSDAGEETASSCQFFRLSFYIGAKTFAEIEDRTEHQQGTSKFIDWR